MTKKNKIYNNQNGSAIVMVLILMLVVSGLVYVNIYNRKMINHQDSRTDIEKDITYLTEYINGIFSSPLDCNVNFFGLSVPTAPANTRMTVPSPSYTMANIKKCAGACTTAGAMTNTVVIVPQLATANWVYDTGSTFTGATKRVRVNSITWRVTTAQKTGTETPNLDTINPAIVTVTVNFQKNLSTLSTLDNVTSGFVNNPKLKTSFESREFSALVVTRRNVFGTWQWNEQGTIIGCAKTPNTTSVY